MIQNLSLQNFRKVVSDEMTFLPGMNILRGANEISKTTRVEALVYAMFGTKALRTSIDDCVTWGCDVKSLKVSVTLRLGGEGYTITRSKGGAEVVKNGSVFVTGQTEVSNFVAQLIGADAATAAKLFLAGQNSIRGALEEGPKALAQMIEELAGFSAFDQILEAASQKLALGSPSLLEERLKGATATLAAATEALPAAQDEAAHVAEVATLTKQIEEARNSIAPLAKISDELTVKHRDASAKFVRKMDMQQAASLAADAYKAAEVQVEALREAAAVEVEVSAIERLKTQIAEADNYESRKIAYDKFLALPDGMRCETPEAIFEKDAIEGGAARKSHEKRLSEIDSALSKLAFQRINHDKCDKCGQDITHLTTVKETNDRVDAETARLNAERALVQVRVDAAVELDNWVSATRSFAAKFNAGMRGIESFVSLDDTTYPPSAVWVGSTPTNPAPHAPRRELEELKVKVKGVEAAKAKLELALEQAAKAEGVSKRAIDALAAVDAPDSAEILRLTKECEQALIKAQAAEGHVILLTQQVGMIQQSFNQAKQLWASAQARITDAQAVIDACNKDLGSLGFNNALVKKLRTIRPMIADRLWSTVLASVSVMFSQIRGEASIVTKEKAGFIVNGQAVESLSGSTLDALGLALRCALIRTFIPNCGLLVLDEVAAGMDETRTQAMLGFLQGLGMEQVLLVTHEEISSAIADNIIELI